MLQSHFVPIAASEEALTVAMADPTDRFAVDAIELATGMRVERRLGTSTDIAAALRRHYGKGSAALDAIADVSTSASEDELRDIQQLKDLASEAPIIRVVNLIIARALEIAASDIHIEPFEHRLKIRYRVDGVLQESEAPPVHSTAAVISRVKVMARLNIAERRLPQDGRIKLRIEGREIDMRVSTVPTLFGESVVLRILDKDRVPLDFTSLGFTRDTLPAFEELVGRPHGILLVTGPTGSGKTTTLYAALEALNTPDKKILTVEDPVEYQLEGINQIQVKPQIGLTFANALRSILRQDPDIIMVGEMRDRETAAIAVQSALTGHKVFSTLHTNDAAGSITRLLDMGVEDFLLTSTVNGILAQRLVRTLCPECREPYAPSGDFLRSLARADADVGSPTLYHPVGCKRCGGSGYRGRTSILELMVLTEPIRRAILEQGDATTIRRAAMEAGMIPMYRDGVRKALRGVTSIEEVVRVTRED
jgi:general secretion pathway protein E